MKWKENPGSRGPRECSVTKIVNIREEKNIYFQRFAQACFLCRSKSLARQLPDC